MRTEVPEGWPVVPLSQIAELSLGKMLDKDKNRGELRPYLANINVRWGSFDLQELRKMRFEERETERYCLRSGDIVMCEGGEPGRCALWLEGEPGMMIQKALHRIRPMDGIDGHYLYFALAQKASSGAFAEYLTGGGIKHLPGEKLAKVEVPIPHLDEQRRIAEVLGSVERAIGLAEQSARSARATFNRLIDDLHSRYENNSAPLADFCVSKGLQTGPFGSQLKVADYVDDGIPVIMPSDLRPDGIDFAGAKSTSTQKADQLPQHHLKPGDILFSRRGDVAKCGLYMEGDPPAICGTGCLRARIDVSKADPVLIYFLAQSERCGSWLSQHAVGITMPNLNTSIVGALPIPNLPVPEQTQWVRALLLAEGACRVNENYVVEAQSLKTMLSADLLSGRVRVPA